MKVVNDFVSSATIEKIIQSPSFDPYGCDELIEKTTNIFLNQFEGKRCFILGTGCSLHNHDLSVLQDEIILSVNNIWLCPDVTPKYWFLCAESYLNLLRTSSMLQNFLKRKDIIKFFGIRSHRGTPFFLEAELIKEVAFKYPNVFFIRMDPGRTLDGEELKLINSNRYPKTFNQFFHGVDVMSSLVIPSSYLMGFEKVYLLGIHKRSPYHFYDTPYLMGKMEGAFKTQRRFEFWSKVKAKLTGGVREYGQHPKVMTPELFDHLFKTHYELFEADNRTIAFIEDRNATYDKHSFKKIPLLDALTPENFGLTAQV